MVEIDISGINYFMPLFSFFFVLLIVYAILFKTKILGEGRWTMFFVSFVMAVIFISFSSLELYVRNIIPWFIVFLVIVFFVLLIAGFSTKELDKLMTNKFAWGVIIILIIIFLIVAIKVFNPVFHPDLIITSGENSKIVSQIVNFLYSSKWAGSLLLLIVAAIVAWIVTRK